MKYIEVEKKYVLDDADALRATLADRGAKPGNHTRQIDTYYNAPHRDFLEPEAVSEWLRIRVEDNGDSSFNFKVWHPVDALVKTHADEYETGVTDPEAVRRLLTALNFKEMIKVDKEREEWHLSGEVPVAVAIDTIENLGTFVEFEFKGEAADAAEAAQLLTSFIDNLEAPLGDQVKKGYPHMMLGREH
ncbi:class IV adenylate cyclase [Actinoplanes sp. NPDC049118]|uniref:class IV adenylate cyclase n=1 Tax=Actinoplanes sp. NPDC049118 TaxID=3155769 RepID=UPI0033CCDFF5